MGYDVTIERLPILALFDLKGPRDAIVDWCGAALPPFPDTPNSLIRNDATALCHTGANRWLLRAPLQAESSMRAALRPEQAPPEISIVLVSDTLTSFRITGPDAPDIMAIATPLDLHSSVFAENAVSYTEAFGQKALIMRCDGGFDLAVEQSFGDMIADYLARAKG